ncbi:MAG TPA: hypothetical protein VF775_04025 [Geobacteraceae bacterium]
MLDYIKPAHILMLIPLLPALGAAILAHHRGRNIVGWAIVSALFPIFLLVIYFEKPLREVPGGFKRCSSCDEFIPWKADTCKYCSTAQPSPPQPKSGT